MVNVFSIGIIGTLVSVAMIAGASPGDIKGDMNCDQSVDPIDSLLLLRHDAGKTVNLPPGCDAIGSTDEVVRLTLDKFGDGAVISEPGGIDCAESCSLQEALFVQGETITLTATEVEEYTFAHWTGCDLTSGLTCTVTVDKNWLVLATFVLAPPRWPFRNSSIIRTGLSTRVTPVK